MTEPRPDTATLYRDLQGGYRWKRTAPNGEIVAASSESYVLKSHCIENFRRIVGALAPELEEE